MKIKVTDLKKQYGEHDVLKGISFEVKKGEIFALLGTNGAGKTTTLECLEGIRPYTSGQIEVNGKIGVQLQSTSLPEGIKTVEALGLFAKWHKAQVDQELVERLGLNKILKKQYKAMSTGQKRRLHLALAMLGDPDIIFLDEPTAGLDVEGRVALHEEIRRLKQQGKTIIMATHDMAEVESLCDRLAILKDGKIAFMGTVNELALQKNTTYSIAVKIQSDFDYSKLDRCGYKGNVQGYEVFETQKIDEGLLELLTLLKAEGITTEDLKIERMSLEECFMDIAKEEKE